MSEKEWAFETEQEKRAINTLSLAGAVAYVGALAAVFNPIALGVAGGYAAYRMARDFAYPHFFKDQFEQAAEKMFRNGRYEEVSAVRGCAQEIDGLSKSYKLEKSPKVYWLTLEQVKKTFLPWYLQWVPLKEESLSNCTFGADGGHNAIVFMLEALKRADMDRSSLRYVYAHELGHLKTRDSFSAHSVIRHLHSCIDKAVLPGLGIAYVAGLMGSTVSAAISTPILLATGLWAGAKVASSILLNAASRIQETRADRNAIYISGELEGARLFLPEHGKELPKYEFSTHPSDALRMQNMTATWKRLSEYKRPELDLMPRKRNRDVGMWPQ